MQGEIYYIVGNPAHLKSEFFNLFNRASQDIEILRIPRLFTTDQALVEMENVYYVDERDFELRNSMGIYCLTWKKAEHSYGVCGEGAQWAQNGYSVVINGSLHNVEKALKIFPSANVVMLRLEDESKALSTNTLLEVENASLTWVNSANRVDCPYILNLYHQEAMNDAVELLIEFITYNRQAMLDKAV